MVWVAGGTPEGQREVFGPFGGCLVIMNLDDPKMPPAYKAQVKEAIDQAHCDGFAIVSLYEMGVEKYPDDLEAIEGMDFGRLFHAVWKGKTADFSLYPVERQNQLSEMAKAVFSQEDLTFGRRLVRIMGSCRIAGEPTMIPMIEFSL